MTTLADLKGQTVAFAASGGLDSCTVTRWLASWRRRSASSVQVVRKPQVEAPAFEHAYWFAIVFFSFCLPERAPGLT